MMLDERLAAACTAEVDRLGALRRYGILDTAAEPAFDRLTALAARLLDMPIAFVTLVDADRLWIKSRQGLAVPELPRELAFCDYAIQGDDVMVVPDLLKDERFSGSPLVISEPFIRFYAGAPLATSEGFKIGTLCVLDRKPREFGPDQIALLSDMAALVVSQLELRLAEVRQVEAEAHNRSLDMLHEVVDFACDLVWETDAELRLTHCFGPSLPRLGIDPDRLNGTALPALFDRSFVRASDQHRNLILARKTFRDLPLLIPTPRGENRQLRVSGKALFDKSGGFAGYRGVASDVTEREADKEALRHSEAEFRAAFDLGPIGMAIIDGEGRYIRVNPALSRLLGYPEAELLGRPTRDFFHPDEQAEFGKGIEQLASGEVSLVQKQRRYVTRTGEVLPTMLQLVALDDCASECRYLVQIIDLSDIKHAEAERAQLLHAMHRAQKLEAIGTLAGGVAHDFNNILIAIRGYTQLAIEDLPATSAIRDDLEQVLKASHRAEDLVKQILAFSRQEAGERKAVAVLDVVQEALRLLRPTLPRTTRLELATTLSDVRIIADATQLHQVIVNLAVNASQALNGLPGSIEVELDQMVVNGGRADGLRTAWGGDKAHPLEVAVEDDGRVQLWAGLLKNGDHVRLRLRDSGSGMSEAVMSRIFEPFFTTKGKSQGTGLGLAAVHGIVTSHNGAIHVSSRAGEGTIFDVFFPVAGTAAKAEEPKAERDSKRRCIGRVMVVDDEEAVLDVNARVLSRAGYEVFTFNDPMKALDAFRVDPLSWRAVVTDQAMPSMTGVALSEHLLAACPTLPIVLCTGYSDTVDERIAQLKGISRFALKPLTGADLLRVLESAAAAPA